MPPTDRQAIEAKAERCLRRGELSEAFSLFRKLAAAFPHDAALARRLSELEESLQPAELTSSKANFRAEPVDLPRSDTEHAEHLAAAGDYAGAIVAYRRLLAARPDNELVRERLAELFTLARAAAPRPSAPTATREAVLGELLSRIGARKRA
ncbi:MAG: tetratricopeptide repeat protein [Myxococcaceae bacterium]|jgi:tetratricopeptide (TPR) repeat protein|nr:tetratricopeptide repeat protein [Myxococcaceae bacterium]